MRGLRCRADLFRSPPPRPQRAVRRSSSQPWYVSSSDAGTSGNDLFVLLARGTATSAVGTGKIGWYQEDLSGTANDRTILRINNDADAAIDMTIEIKGLVTFTAADFVL